MPDPDLLRHVWHAVETLALSPTGLTDRLRAAMSDFAVALGEPDRWPQDSELLKRANALAEDYLSRPANLSLSEARDLAERLLEVARDVECAVAIAMQGQ